MSFAPRTFTTGTLAVSIKMKTDMKRLFSFPTCQLRRTGIRGRVKTLAFLDPGPVLPVRSQKVEIKKKKPIGGGYQNVYDL